MWVEWLASLCTQLIWGITLNLKNFLPQTKKEKKKTKQNKNWDNVWIRTLTLSSPNQFLAGWHYSWKLPKKKKKNPCIKFSVIVKNFTQKKKKSTIPNTVMFLSGVFTQFFSLFSVCVGWLYVRLWVWFYREG